MKKLLLLFVILVSISGCVSKKYGCKNSISSIKCIKYAPHKHLYSGHGYVDSIPFESTQYYIRISGILVKDDSFITPVKFLLVFGNKAIQKLKTHKKSTIYFEINTITDKFAGDDILEVMDITLFDIKQEEQQASLKTNTNDKKS